MDLVFWDAGIFIGALCSGDARHDEARKIVEAARRGELAACTSVGVLSEVYAALTWTGAQPPQTPDEREYGSEDVGRKAISNCRSRN